MPGPVLTIDFVSKDAVAAELKKYHDKAIPALAAAMYQVATAVIADAIPRAPKRTGTLRNSGYVALPVVNGPSVTVTGGFGGFAKAYAWAQHERLDYRHTEGGPKYLERALDAHADSAVDYIADAIAKAFESGTIPTLNGNGLPTSASGIAEARAAKRAATAAKRVARAASRTARAARKAAAKKTAAAAKRKRAVKRVAKGAKRLAKGAKRAGKAAAKSVKRTGKAAVKGARKLLRGKRRRRK